MRLFQFNLATSQCFLGENAPVGVIDIDVGGYHSALDGKNLMYRGSLTRHRAPNELRIACLVEIPSRNQSEARQYLCRTSSKPSAPPLFQLEGLPSVAFRTMSPLVQTNHPRSGTASRFCHPEPFPPHGFCLRVPLRPSNLVAVEHEVRTYSGQTLANFKAVVDSRIELASHL
jgi:hypothetical protein